MSKKKVNVRHRKRAQVAENASKKTFRAARKWPEEEEPPLPGDIPPASRAPRAEGW